MKISELGEFEFIKRLASKFTYPLSNGLEGIGDDCAIIPYKNGTSLLITTDMLIERIHFLRTKISPEDLGYKAFAVNLSDIAAMGGSPLYAFLSIALTPDTELDWTDRFLEGMHQLCEQTETKLLGGNTARSEADIIINITLVGQIQTDHIKRRSQAKIGDFICCTGYLGNSGGGLRVLLDSLSLNEITLPLVHDHCHPNLHLQQGQWLASQSSVHAMIDVSDGIDRDLRHIMENSQCGAEIDIDQLPISQDLKRAASKFNWNLTEIALTAGEDYCLLITIDARSYHELQKSYAQMFGQSLFKIGTITNRLNQLRYLKNSQSFILESKGFDHFKFKPLA